MRNLQTRRTAGGAGDSSIPQLHRRAPGKERQVIVRDLKDADLPVLREIYDRAKYEFPWPELMKQDEVSVVVDDYDVPIMAACSRVIPEMTLICAPGGRTHALVKLEAIAMLHESLREKLVQKGYNEAIASVPPELEKNYARHLEKHFGWRESWKTYRIRDWKKAGT
jgi:hypothetical protein